MVNNDKKVKEDKKVEHKQEDKVIEDDSVFKKTEVLTKKEIENLKSELKKNNPKIDLPLNIDANHFLNELIKALSNAKKSEWNNWTKFCQGVKKILPLNDEKNTNKKGYINFFIAMNLEKFLELNLISLLLDNSSMLQ